MKQRKRKFTGVVEVALLDPVKWEDRKISVVRLDFAKVTGKTLTDIDLALKNTGLDPDPYNLVTYQYIFQFAAAISGIPARAFMKMSGDDADAIWKVILGYRGGQSPQEVYDELCEDTDDNSDQDEEGFQSPAN